MLINAEAGRVSQECPDFNRPLPAYRYAEQGVATASTGATTPQAGRESQSPSSEVLQALWSAAVVAERARHLKPFEMADLPDEQSYFQLCLGDTYTPSHMGKHEAAHPVRVREALETLKGQKGADVIAALVFEVELARARACRLLDELSAKGS